MQFGGEKLHVSLGFGVYVTITRIDLGVYLVGYHAYALYQNAVLLHSGWGPPFPNPTNQPSGKSRVREKTHASLGLGV